MQAIWITLKENVVNCRSKLTDVVAIANAKPKKCSKEGSYSTSYGKENSDVVELQQTGNHICQALFRRNYPTTNDLELHHQPGISVHKVLFRTNQPMTNEEVALHLTRNSVRKVLFRPNHPGKKEVELHQAGISVREEVLFRPIPNHPRTHYYKIDIGDPSRNIIEKIFQNALMDSSKPSRKIKRVLKVKNPKVLERFEKYREKVKKKAYEQSKGHPRSSVDGNELLRFYGTVITCSERSTQVTELCMDPFCRVCRIIHSNFDKQHIKKNGIRLSTSSDEFCDNMVALRKMKNIKRAVIICRTIAGLVANLVDGALEECDSFRSEGLHSNSECLTVKKSLCYTSLLCCSFHLSICVYVSLVIHLFIP